MSDRKFLFPSAQLQKLLGSIFDYWTEVDDAALHKEYRRDFVFHMTDWLNDLEDLRWLYHHPDETTRAEAAQFIFGFLIHVIPHLNAAGRLVVGEVGDAFAHLYRDKSTFVKEGDSKR